MEKLIHRVAQTVSTLAIFAIAIAASFSQTTAKDSMSKSTAEDMQMPLAFPLYLEGRSFSSTLVLINPANRPSAIDVVLRNEEGRTVITRRVQMVAQSQQRIPVSNLLVEAGLFSRRGSILLQSLPHKKTAITGALSITQSTPKGLHYIDEEPAMPMKESSSTLRALSDAISGSPVVSITSLSASSQIITFTCFSPQGVVRRGTFMLSMGATESLNLCKGDAKGDYEAEPDLDKGDFDQTDISYGIALVSNQASGSFAAFGMGEHREAGGRYFTSVPFSDPMMLHSPNTVFAGVPIGSVNLLPGGKYTPLLTIANFSDHPAHVTAMYYAGETTSKLGETIVGAWRSTTVPLSEISGDPQLEDSVIVTSDREPGEVIPKLVSLGTGTLREVELPGKDEADMFNSGQHPWSLENETESNLLLFNHSKDKATFEVEIDKDDVSWDKHYILNPKQTLALDIRTLINNSVPDDKGRKLHRTGKSEYGQVAWNTDGPAIASGRLLQTNASTAMARSFSCGAQLFICGTNDFSPGTFAAGDYGAGGITGIQGCVGDGGCIENDTTTRRPSISRYSWWSDDTAITSISGSNTSSSASFYGAGPGDTMSNGRAYDGYGCYAGPTKPVTVQVPTSLKVLSVNILQQGTQQDHGCLPGYYGIQIDIKYQVMDQSTPAKPIMSSSMTPLEYVTFYDGSNNGGYNPIGPTSVSTTSAKTRTDGTFDDAPVGICSAVPFNTALTTTQMIKIMLNGTSYAVRSNSFSMSSTNLVNHGTITNGSDINSTQ